MGTPSTNHPFAASLLAVLLVALPSAAGTEEDGPPTVANDPRVEDGLAVVWLDERELKEAVVKLKKTGDHVFRRVRKDDKSQLGEEFVFDVDEDGTVRRYKQHSNWYRKVR